MKFLNFFFLSTFVSASVFSSAVPQEGEGEGAITCASIHFETLTPDVMKQILSFVSVLPLEDAQELVTVSKFFHRKIVPNISFSWRPLTSPILPGGKFSLAYASQVLMLNLNRDNTFRSIYLEDFKNLTL